MKRLTVDATIDSDAPHVLQVIDTHDPILVKGDLMTLIRTATVAASAAGVEEVVIDTTGVGFNIFEELRRQGALAGAKWTVVAAR